MARPRQGLPPPARPRRQLLDLPPPPLRRPGRGLRARAVRRLLRQPRPGRQPARSATGCPTPVRPLAAFVTLLSARSSRCSSWATSTASPRRSSSSRTTSTRRSPSPPGRAAARVRLVRRFVDEDVPDPQDPATFERSKLTRRARTRHSSSCTATSIAARRDLPAGDAEIDLRRGGALAARAPRRPDPPHELLPKRTLPMPAATEILAHHPSRRPTARCPPLAGALVR